jgi:hypothetical protein
MIWTDHYNDLSIHDIENDRAEDFEFCNHLAKGRRAIPEWLWHRCPRNRIVSPCRSYCGYGRLGETRQCASVSWVLRFNRGLDLVLLIGRVFLVLLALDDRALI